VRQRLGDIQRHVPVLQLGAVVVVFAYGNATIVGFGARVSINTMLVLAAILGLAALGQTLVMILGGLDLSVPGFILVGALGSVSLAKSVPFGVALALLVGAAAATGAVVGWLCGRFRIQPLVLTLAVGAAVGGIVTASTTAGDLPPPPGWLTSLASPASTTFGAPVPPLAVIWAVVAVAIAIVLHKAPFGRRVYATGENMRAAGLALIPTRRIWAVVFALSAAASTAAGVLLSGFAGSGNAHLGDPYLFQGLTAVIVGGTTFFGIRGDYTHTVLGALLMTELSTVLVGKGLSNAGQQMLFGVLILLVVAIYGRQARVQDRV
jgi:ribose transport system permease protein